MLLFCIDAVLSERFGTAVLEAMGKCRSLLSLARFQPGTQQGTGWQGRTRAGKGWEGMGSYTNVTAQGFPAPEGWSRSYLEAWLYGGGSAPSHKSLHTRLGYALKRELMHGAAAVTCQLNSPDARRS